MIRHVCRAVRTLGFRDNTNARKPADTAYQIANNTIGALAAIATAIPTRCALFLNKPNADAANAIPNHTAISRNVSFL